MKCFCRVGLNRDFPGEANYVIFVSWEVTLRLAVVYLIVSSHIKKGGMPFVSVRTFVTLMRPYITIIARFFNFPGLIWCVSLETTVKLIALCYFTFYELLL